MAWIPSFKIDGGMYAGRKAPDGDLSGFISYQYQITTSDAYILGTKLTADGNPWNGKFGLQSDLVTQLWRNNLDGEMHEFVLAEIEIEPPEGATYYKQTLVYVARALARPSQHYTQTIQGVTYEADATDVEFGLYQVKRYEYATPYSTPTVDTFVSGTFRGFAARYKLSGDDQALSGNNVLYRDKDFIITIGYGSYQGQLYHICGCYAEMGYCYAGLMGVSVEYWEEHFGPMEVETTEDPNEDDDEDGDNGDEEGGGDGDHDKRQDNILIPDLPSLSASGAGFVTMYRMTQSNMLSFARKLFDPDVWDTVKAFFADPLDFICGIMIVPYSPTTDGMAMPIFPRQAPLPDIEWGEYYQVIENQYKVIDCGSYTIPLFYNSAFDYSPYTKITVWLPYIGYRDLNADEVMGSTIHIEYHCDCLTGDCIAFISRLAISGGSVPVNQVIAQFNGNCGVRVPFGRMSFDSAITGSMQLIAGAAGALGGIASMIAGAGGMPSGGKQLAEGMVASQVGGMAMGAVNAMKARVERAGAAGASAGYMAIQKPYIIRQIPHQSLPSNYRRLNGYPANIGDTLGNFSGYTCVESIELTGINATAEEKREILSLLTGGVIV